MARFLLIAYTTYVHDGRVKRHAEALAERGDHVDVICLDSGHNGVRDGVNVIGLQMPRYRGASRSSYMRSYLRFFAKASCAELRLTLVERYDVAIVCTMPDAAVLCALPAKLLGTRIVLDVHDTMPELYQDKFGGRRGAMGARLLMLEERTSARCADRVLAVHALHRARLIRAGISEHKIRTVMNAPDPAFFHAMPDRRERSEGAFIVACHGTLTRRLGLDIAIEAMALVHPRIPHARLMVIGTGDYLEVARQLVVRKQLEQCVVFIDQVPVHELPRLLAGVDVGLVPNRASNATHLMLRVKLLDYMALGIPTIAARLRSIEHYFSEREVRFFEPGDTAALAAAIEELHRDRVRRVELAHNARQAMERVGWPAQRREVASSGQDLDLLEKVDRFFVVANSASVAIEILGKRDLHAEIGRLRRLAQLQRLRLVDPPGFHASRYRVVSRRPLRMVRGCRGRRFLQKRVNCTIVLRGSSAATLVFPICTAA